MPKMRKCSCLLLRQARRNSYIYVNALAGTAASRPTPGRSFSFVENPIQLVEVRGISKRKRKQADPTVEQCFLILGLLPEPYRTMALTALCTGMRIEEILALNWAKIDFVRLCMTVDEASVHGRLGPVKTEYSDDELPLDPDFATALLQWKLISKAGESGLVFPSHITGHCYHASPAPAGLDSSSGVVLGRVPGVRCSARGFAVPGSQSAERSALSSGCIHSVASLQLRMATAGSAGTPSGTSMKRS